MSIDQAKMHQAVPVRDSSIEEIKLPDQQKIISAVQRYLDSQNIIDQLNTNNIFNVILYPGGAIQECEISALGNPSDAKKNRAQMRFLYSNNGRGSITISKLPDYGGFETERDTARGIGGMPKINDSDIILNYKDGHFE